MGYPVLFQHTAALVTGTIAQGTVTGYQAQISIVTHPSWGSPPYTWIWRRRVSGVGSYADLTVGSADEVTLLDQTVSPSTSYDYIVRWTDAVAGTIDSAPLTVVVPARTEGWGVLGDSRMDEYRGDLAFGAGTPHELTTLDPVEILANTRALNFGAWGTYAEPRRTGYGQNWARAAAVIDHLLAGQVAGVVAQVQAGTVTHVMLAVPTNDWGNLWPRFTAVYNSPDGGIHTSDGYLVQDLIDRDVAQVISSIDQIVAAGVAGIVVQVVADFSAIPDIYLNTFTDATKRGYITAAIRNMQTLIEARGSYWNTYAGHNLVVVFEQTEETVFSTATAAASTVGSDYIVPLAGVDLISSSVDANASPLYFWYDTFLTYRIHFGTVVNGVIANLLIGYANQLTGIAITPLTDAEIRVAAGIDEGVAAVGLGALTTTAAGTVLVQGAGTAGLGAFALTSTGTVLVQGVGIAGLGAFTVTAASSVPAQGTGTAGLGAFTVTSTGTVLVQGAATVDLGAFTITSVAAGESQGTVALGAFALTATGTVLVQGTGTAGLGAFTVIATTSAAPVFMSIAVTVSQPLSVAASVSHPLAVAVSVFPPRAS